MGLRMKILLGFLILSLMLLIAGVWSIYEFKSIGISVQNLLDDNYTSITSAKMMTEALEREDSAILLLLLGKWEKGRAIMTSADSLFNQGYQLAQDESSIPGEDARLDSIKSSYSSFKNLWKKPIVGTKKEGDLDWYFNEVHDSFLVVKKSVNQLIVLNEKMIYKTASELHNKANRAIMPGIVAIISALVFSLVFNYFVNYYAVSPIVKITDRIKLFLEKKVSFKVEIETKDEFAELASAIKTVCTMVEDYEAK